MCKATAYSEKLNELILESVNEKINLTKRLSEIDKEISNLYHGLESMKINASQGFKISKHLQKLVQERRGIKKEIIALSVFIDGIGMKKMQNKIIHTNNMIKNHLKRESRKNNNKGVEYITKVILAEFLIQ